MTANTALPLPPFYDPANVVNDNRWIDYNALQQAATDWRRQHGIKSAATDRVKVGFLGIDIQNTFCHPSGELFVAGMSGTGAVDDSIRTVEFLYRNLDVISGIACTLDTHRTFAVFHPSFLVDQSGKHPAPFTQVTNADIKAGVWGPSPLAASATGASLMWLTKHLDDYTAKLEKKGRYALTIWPYHGVLGDKGHNLVSGLAEVANFHGLVRGVQPGFEIKGTNPLVENYSVLGPEVDKLHDGTAVNANSVFEEKLLKYDVLAVTGQAKSHCVAWSIDDLLTKILAKDPALAKKVYIIEDCTTPILVKDPVSGAVVFDYGPDANAAFDKFRSAGMHVVKSTTPIWDWPDVRM